MDEEEREANWTLRKRLAKLHAEFEFLSRESVQLCHKRFLKPPVETIDLTEVERKFLKDLRDRKLKEVVTKQCMTVIKFLMSQKFLSYPFNEPVDTVTYRDYLNYVRTPMDFGTIKGKINHYKTPAEFEADVRLVFENAKKYNAPETEVREMARQLEVKFEEKWTKSVLPKIEELKKSEDEDQIAFKQSKADNVTMEAETRVDECCRLLLNRLQALYEEIKHVQCIAAAECKVLTEQEQLRLGWELTTLAPEHFQRVVNLILMRHPGMIATMKDNTIDFDLNKMDCLTLRQLQAFCKHCKKQQDRTTGAEENGQTERSSVRKRLKRSNPSSGNLQSEGGGGGDWSVEDRSNRWPMFTFGIGLKPYDAEVEPFIPPNSEDATSLPYSSICLNSSYSCPSTEFGTPKSTSPTCSRTEELPQQQQQLPQTVTSTSPLRHVSPFAHPGAREDIAKRQTEALSAGTPVPSMPTVASMTTPLRQADASQHSLMPSNDAAYPAAMEIRPPTVLVSSAGIAAIPLIPVTQPATSMPSLFTANISSRSSTGMTSPAPYIYSGDLFTTGGHASYPQICNFPLQPVSAPLSTQSTPAASLPEPSQSDSGLDSVPK